MKNQLIWVKSVHYWWSYILFSPERKELTSMLDPLCCYQVCALDHANVGTADLDYSSGPSHRNASNELQWLDLKIGHQNDSPNDDHQPGYYLNPKEKIFKIIFLTENIRIFILVTLQFLDGAPTDA